jgi:hypothetical protein
MRSWLLSVVLSDVWVFDDHLPLGDGIGTRIEQADGAHEVTGYGPNGYALQRVWTEPVTRVTATGPIVAGREVHTEQGDATVLSVRANVLTLRSERVRWARIRVDDPDDVEVPLLAPIAVLAAAVLAFALRARYPRRG